MLLFFTMASRALSAQDALDVVLDSNEQYDDLSDSSEGLMSSGEESELDDALVAGQFDFPAGDDEVPSSADEVEERPNSLPAQRPVDTDDGETSSDMSEGECQREPRRPVARGRRGVERSRRGCGRGAERGRHGRRGRARGAASAGGRGRRRTAATAGAGQASDTHGWDADDEEPTLPGFTPSRQPGCYFPDDFQPTHAVDFFRLFSLLK